jgi:hypothetical protein
MPAEAQEPKPLPHPLADPAFLASRTWKSDPGLDKVLSDWPLYEGEQGFKDRTVVRRTKVLLPGATLDAEHRVISKDSLAEIVLFGNKFDESFCSRFSEWTMPRFGVPAKVIDMSLPPSKDEAYIQLDADWLFGTTRVQFSCSGVKVSDRFVPVVAMLVYRHHTMQKALEDLIYIECSSTQKWVGKLWDERRATEEVPPMRFLINPNAKDLFRWNKLTIGKTQRYSDEEIVTTWGDEKYSSVLRLDRRAGSYLLQVRQKSGEQVGLDRWGKCSRTTPEKKF